MPERDAEVRGGARQVRGADGVAAVLAGERVLQARRDGAHVHVVVVRRGGGGVDLVNNQGEPNQQRDEHQGAAVRAAHCCSRVKRRKQ